MAFRPEEVLFSPTTKCNLKCAHCGVKRSGLFLSADLAARFLASCRRGGIKRVGFTGGEPFLAPDFLCELTAVAVRHGMIFDRIMTNGVWWRDEDDLKRMLVRLFNAGYDGTICVSIDAFHGQNLKKVSRFIELVNTVWRRGDIITIAYVHVPEGHIREDMAEWPSVHGSAGRRDTVTKGMLSALSKLLGCRLKGFGSNHPHIKNSHLFIKIKKIEMSSVSKASRLKNPWNGRWFREDYCKGPGNALFVLPDGNVKPCCGYANESAELTIGNIKKDSARNIVNNFKNNRLAHTIFSSGLSSVRDRLLERGFRFPGQTSDHCFFCDFIMNKVPKRLLKGCVAAVLILFGAGMFSRAEAQELKRAKCYSRIEPRVVRTVSVPRSYHEGLFFDGKNILLANGMKGKIWAIDTSSGEVVSTIDPVSDFAEAVIIVSGSFYTTEWYDKKLYKARMENNKLVPESEVSFAPAHPAGLVWNGSSFYVVAWTRGLGTKFELLELDRDMKITRRIRIRCIQEPCQLAWDGKNLWVTSWYSKEVYKIDTEKWEIAGYFRSPVDKTTGIAWDGNSLWLTGTYSDLYQIEMAG